MKNKIIVALDVPSLGRAVELVEQTSECVGIYKVGKEILNSEGLPQVVRALRKKDCKLFVDVKESDIPNTVAGAVTAAAKAGADIINVHATGGQEMMKAAVKAGKAVNPDVKIIAVSILTSLGEGDMTEIGFIYPPEQMVYHLAQLAKDCHMDGLVCSPKEVAGVREIMGPDALLITPGIRPVWDSPGDQKRITTPSEAILMGSSAMVIGRSITAHSHYAPSEAAMKILDEIKQTSTNPVKVPTIKEKFIQELFKHEIVKVGNFKLKSGAFSPIYIDVRNMPSFPTLFGNAIYHITKVAQTCGFDRVCGVPMGGLSFAARLAQSTGKPLLTLRQEAKDHGVTGSQTVETFNPEDKERVIVFEDVATTGGSTMTTINKLRDLGLDVCDVVVLVNRKQGADELLEKEGVRLHSVLTLKEITDTLQTSIEISPEDKRKIAEYMNSLGQ